MCAHAVFSGAVVVVHTGEGCFSCLNCQSTQSIKSMEQNLRFVKHLCGHVQESGLLKRKSLHVYIYMTDGSVILYTTVISGTNQSILLQISTDFTANCLCEG